MSGDLFGTVPHYFITVKARRWCLGCDLFQALTAAGWRAPGARWDTSGRCDHDTVWARNKDAERERTRQDICRGEPRSAGP